MDLIWSGGILSHTLEKNQIPKETNCKKKNVKNLKIVEKEETSSYIDLLFT